MAHKNSATQEIICLEEKIICKLGKNEDALKDILKALKKIKKLIVDDIQLDAVILTRVNDILTLLQTVNTNVNTILQILQTLVPIINSINTNVQAILTLVQNINTNVNTLISLACTPISTVPFVISKPGCYKIINELAFTDPGNAITITTSDVILDGGNFTLTLTGSTTVGVSSSGNNNIIIKNFNITSSSTDPAVNTANRAITINFADNVLLDRVHTSFTNRGGSMGATSNVVVKDCIFDSHLNDTNRISTGLIFLAGARNILVKDSKFFNINTLEDVGIGLYLQAFNASVDNVRVTSCQFSDALFFAASFDESSVIQGVVLEDSIFTITNPDYRGWSVVFISEAGNLRVQGITIKNVTISNPKSSNFYEPILLVGVSGFLIEDCNISANSVGNFIDRGIINVALIHLGYTITGILDTEDILDAQVENGTIYKCNLSGGNTLQDNHQNVGIYIEAFTANVVIDKVNISQTGLGNVAPSSLEQIKKKKTLKIMTINGEEDFIRKTTGINKNLVKMEKLLSKYKISPNLKVPPPIPDQRAAAILVDGGSNIIIKDSVIISAGSGVPGTLPGHGIVFSGLLQFQTVPALQPPVLTITVLQTNASKVINTTVSNSQGNGIEDDGIANSIEKCNVKDNTLTGILLNGFTGFVEGNNVFTNFTNGIVNGGGGYAILNNNAALNLPFSYVNVPAVVPQGTPCVAGQNVQVP
jgi:hypothetical protein